MLVKLASGVILSKFESYHNDVVWDNKLILWFLISSSIEWGIKKSILKVIGKIK